MPKLKLGPIADDKPTKITVELPAALYRDLSAYAARWPAKPASLPPIP